MILKNLKFLLFVFTLTICCVSTIGQTYSFATYPVNVPNPASGFNPITNLPNPRVVGTQTVNVGNNDITFSMSRTLNTNSATLSGSPLVFTYSSATNFSSAVRADLDITFSNPVVGLSFCMDDFNCQTGKYKDVLEITAEDASGTPITPIFSSLDSVAVAGNVLSTTCSAGENVVARIAADHRGLTVSFPSAVKKITIKFSGGGTAASGGRTQSVGLCDFTYTSLLPINLFSFKGSQIMNDILLNWSADNHVNFDKFEIQRSENGRNFNKIGEVAPNTNGLIDYSFVDLYPSKNINYYRLKLIDLDGSYSYSNIINIKYNFSKNKISVIPNFANAGNTISINSINKIAHLLFYDVNGKLVTPIVSGNSVRFNKAGNYFVKAIFEDGSTTSEKIIIN